MMKLALVLGFIGIVGVLLYMVWVKVLKPLHSVSVDGDLRDGLVGLVRLHLIPYIKSVPNYNEASKAEIVKHNRQLVEAASDRLFDTIVRLMSQWDKERFYQNTEPGIAAWLEQHLEGQIIHPEYDEEAISFEDIIFNSVINTYIEFSRFATNHPDAVEWTAFGFMSWVNLNIDQILEEELKNQ